MHPIPRDGRAVLPVISTLAVLLASDVQLAGAMNLSHVFVLKPCQAKEWLVFSPGNTKLRNV